MIVVVPAPISVSAMARIMRPTESLEPIHGLLELSSSVLTKSETLDSAGFLGIATEVRLGSRLL